MKIGDYVRTEYGIERITDIKEWVNFQGYEKIITTDKNQYETLYEQSKIIKSSPNIIDLIEAGDYVNGYLVVEHAHEKGRLFVTYTYIGGKGFTTKESYAWELTKDREKDIKSIVIKEQFESIKYEVNNG